MTDEQFQCFCVERIEAHHRFAARHRRDIVGLAQAYRYTLASRDEPTAHYVSS
jgi:alpha-D-ribose 1-methylphosphonate 5-triphosphate diphosphatase PhnM